MNQGILFLLAFYVMGLGQTLAQSKPVSAPAQSVSAANVESAVARVRPSLVRIAVIASLHTQGREIKSESSGSGVIITKEGHIVTNHHVAGRAVRLTCVLSNNEEIPAELVGTDPLTDIAVIKLKTDGKREFPIVRFADSDKVVVGQPILAMGSPLAMSQSVTQGIVSNTRMMLPQYVPELRLEGESVGALVRWLSHDAVIFPGNSGGPLLNLRGEIVGINEIVFGLGGAIPGNLARAVADELIQKGYVTRSWIGINPQPVLKSSGKQKGVLVSTVIQGSPADLAGVRAGDVLTRLDGQPVDVHHGEQLPLFNQLVASVPVGKEIELALMREDKEIKRRLTTVLREPVVRDQMEFRAWGITAGEVTMAIAKELRVEDRNGVVVMSVRPGGPAVEARPPLMPGDIVRAINDEPVPSVDALQSITSKILGDGKKAVAVLVKFDRKTQQFVSVIRIGFQDIDQTGRETRRAWLAIGVQAIARELAVYLKKPDMTGVRVTQVAPGSTAETAGLRTGDLILSVAGQPIPVTRHGEEEVFWTLLRSLTVGDTVDVRIFRNGKEQTLKAELTRAPVPEREMARYEDPVFEFSVRDLSFADRMREGWDEKYVGTLVTDVKVGGWAAVARLAVGDTITEVNGQPINNVKDLEELFGKLSAQRAPVVVLRVQRGIHSRFVEIEPSWDVSVLNPKSRTE